MKVFAITRGGAEKPSTRYRLLQYANLLQEVGDTFEWQPKNKIGLAQLFAIARADVVINQKAPLSWFKSVVIRALSRRLIFEWDDAIHTDPHRPANQQPNNARLHWWLKNSQGIICSNQRLADYARPFNPNLKVITNALDGAGSSQPASPKKLGTEIILGWSGSRSSNVCIQACQHSLGVFLENHPAARLKIMSDADPKLTCRYEFEKWSKEAEKKFFESLTVGLLPLPDDEFSRNKCPIKSLSYRAAGVPIAANYISGGPAEMAASGGYQWVEANDWNSALTDMLEPGRYRELSQAALEALKKHDRRSIFPAWREFLIG